MSDLAVSVIIAGDLGDALQEKTMSWRTAIIAFPGHLLSFDHQARMKTAFQGLRRVRAV
jgi:hypothetical protein